MSRRDGSTRPQPVFMHPVVFIGASALLGVLFALQDWNSMRQWSYHVRLPILLEAWGLQYFLWGVICWILWWSIGDRLQQADLFCIVTRVLPLSIGVSVVEEMLWVLCFPHLPLNHPPMTYWRRLEFHLGGDLLDSLVIFWCAFFLFRGIGYYQQLREKEAAAAELRTQLAQAQVRALRMQLNPHFLFNTMNSISSLMQTDIAVADTMLEQLSSLLRITLERGEVQLINLSDEMEFIEMYLSMQDLRFTGRIRHEISIEPELHDALVPAMLLQPLIENAYTHGLSKLEKEGQLVVVVCGENSMLKISVTNSGLGLDPTALNGSGRQGVGIANVKNRLRLHYGSDQTFAMSETEQGSVQVALTLPLQFSQCQSGIAPGYGA
jgi:two-component system, LytTR family, sensor kinase